MRSNCLVVIQEIGKNVLKNFKKIALKTSKNVQIFFYIITIIIIINNNFILVLFVIINYSVIIIFLNKKDITIRYES